MAIASPVRGFLPSRAGRSLVVKDPKPAMVTGSPFSRASVIASNTAVTAEAASDFESDVAGGNVRGELPAVHGCASDCVRRPMVDDASRLVEPVAVRRADAWARARRAVLHRDAQLHSERAGDPHERGEGGIAVRRERLVDPDAGHAGLVGELGDAVGAGDVVERGADEAPVARVLLGAGFEVPAHVLAVVQIARRIPPLEGFGHGFFRRLARRAARSTRHRRSRRILAQGADRAVEQEEFPVPGRAGNVNSSTHREQAAAPGDGTRGERVERPGHGFVTSAPGCRPAHAMRAWTFPRTAFFFRLAPRYAVRQRHGTPGGAGGVAPAPECPGERRAVARVKGWKTV